MKRKYLVIELISVSLMIMLTACGYDENRDNEENVSSNTITSVDSDETEMNWEQFVTYEPISTDEGKEICSLNNCFLVFFDHNMIIGRQEEVVGYKRAYFCILKDAEVYCFCLYDNDIGDYHYTDNYVHLGRVSSETMQDISRCVNHGRIETYQCFYPGFSSSHSCQERIPRGPWIDYYERFRYWNLGSCIIIDPDSTPHTMWERRGTYMDGEEYIINDEECLETLIWVVESDFFQKWEEYKGIINFRQIG